MNYIKACRLALISAVLSLANLSGLAQDTTASREAAADRYLKTVTIAKLLDDTFNEFSKQLPLEQRAQFIRDMKKAVRADFLERVIRQAMIKAFTADELNALADFYGSKHGSSVMLKFGAVMSAFEAEVQRDVKELQKSGLEGVKQDKSKAVGLYTKACDGGDMLGCSNLGLIYAKGEGVQQDNFKAVELQTKACDGGNTFGCSNLGEMYYKGWGIRQDKSKAVELYTKACDGGYAGGCINLGVMYKIGERGVQQNLNHAMELFGKACDLRTERGCDEYVRLKRGSR